MIIKYIGLHFASWPVEFTIEEISNDIIEAVEYAGCNLFVQHKIRLKYDQNKSQPEIGIFVVGLQIPEEKAIDFNFGPHLRGISIYLLNKDKRYGSYKVGTRLLVYQDIYGIHV